MDELGRVEDFFELSETLIDCILTSQRESMHNAHTLSLKVSSPEILIVKSSEIRSRCSKLGWCLTHVGGLFADEEMPCSFLPFFGAICCGLHNTRPIPHQEWGPPTLFRLPDSVRESRGRNSALGLDFSIFFWCAERAFALVRVLTFF